MIDDLRRFRASPEVPRLAVALIVTAAVMLFAVASTSLPNPDNEAPQVGVSDQPHMNVMIDSESPAAASPTPLGCTKLYRGQWLRVEIAHSGDREPYRLECFHGYGPAWEAM